MAQLPIGQGVLLVVVAAPSEARAIVGKDVEAWTRVRVGERAELIMTGVGKSNAAGATGRLFDGRRHTAVVSLGIAGALPRGGAVIGEVVVAGASVFADEGVQTPQGFEDLAGRGFPPWGGTGSSVPTTPDLAAWMKEVLSALTVVRDGAVATVSTCSGTDELATQIAARTGAIAEAMEGAAVGATAARMGAAFGEVRVISNTTGDRGKQTWDLRGSLEILGRVGRTLIEAADRVRESRESKDS